MNPGPLRCPTCQRALTDAHLRGGQACGCGRVQTLWEGVPLLVGDPQQHLDFIKEQTARNPAWYDQTQKESYEGPYRHHLKKRRELVMGYLNRYFKEGRPGLGLDLGCGDGMNLSWLKPYAEQWYASDYNPIRLGRVKRNHPDIKLFLADIRSYPALDSSFDLIFFNHVLEHIPDDQKALMEVYRVLKPGGLLVLGVPNEGAWFWDMAYERFPGSREASDHVHFYTADSLEPKCEKAGFQLLKTYHLGWGVPHWGWDEKLRSKKWVDDLFHVVGKVLIPKQASSLYLMLGKKL